MDRIWKGTVVACIATTTLMLSGCASSLTQSEQDKSSKELVSRGFTDPVYVSGHELPVWSVGLGECRVELIDGNSAWGWTYGDLRDVDAPRLKDLASELGLTACWPTEE